MSNNKKVGKSCDLGVFYFYFFWWWGVGESTNSCDPWVDATLFFFFFWEMDWGWNSADWTMEKEMQSLKVPSKKKTPKF